MRTDKEIIDSINHKIGVMRLQEKEYARRISRIDGELQHLAEQKRVLKKQISRTVRHRMDLVNQRAKLYKNEKNET